MAIKNINRGVTPNDETGDSARAGALKINENFAYLLNAKDDYKTNYAKPTIGGTVKMRITGSDLFITNNGENP